MPALMSDRKTIGALREQRRKELAARKADDAEAHHNGHANPQRLDEVPNEREPIENTEIVPPPPVVEPPDISDLVHQVAVNNAAGRPRSTDWPAIDDAAFHGLVGDVVATLDPHTEADPVGVAVTFLAGAGAVIGRGPHAEANAAEHPARIFPVTVGSTSDGRKGSAWATTRRLLSMVDGNFFGDRGRVMGGFGSGEAVVDELAETAPGEDEPRDHRLLVYEAEIARLYKVGARDGSTLSPLLRAAWDGETLAVRSRSKKSVAVGAHVVIVGSITPDELRRTITETEAASGFANRFLFVLVRRSKLLPEGGNLGSVDLEHLARRIRDRVLEARKIGVVRRDEHAKKLWADLYRQLADTPREGLTGAVTARAEAQLLRLSVLYALLDGARLVTVDHLNAAWALWRYCEASASHIFGDTLGDANLDKLHAAIRRAGPNGLDGTEQARVFSNNLNRQQMDRLRADLETAGRIVTVTEDTGGRPRLRSIAKDAQ